jgi:multiple sugar transport system ATP-binding protein
MSTIKLNDLVKVYEADSGTITAVDEVSLQLEHGKFYSFLGASGCGKTTTLRCIAGLEQPTDGEVYFDDEEVTQKTPQQRDVEMVFQHIALYPHMTCRQNIGYGLKIQNVPEDERNERIMKAAETLQIADQLDKSPSELSGGQQQRVALARAFVKDPEILLLDEPMTGLDAKLKEELRVELQELHRRLDATIVYVTHDQTEAMSMSDEIVLLDDGQIEQIGTPEELFDYPVSRHVAEFVGKPSTNFLDLPVERNGSEYVVPRLGVEFSSDDRTDVGETVEVGIRPHYLHRGTGDVQFSIDVRVTENLGMESVVHGNLPSGEPFDVVVTDVSDIESGDTLTVSCDRDDIYLFDDSGRNLATGAQDTESRENGY